MRPKWTRTSSVLSRLMRVNVLALSDWAVSDPPAEMHLHFCSMQKDSAVCCTPPPPPRNPWDSTTVPAVVSVPLMCLQPVWFSCKFRHDVCGGRHRWARRNVIEDYKRGTASKYSICHTFVWEQKGWRTVSSYYEPIVFSYPCPPSPLLLPYKYCLCWMVLSCIHYYNTALPAISVLQIFSIQAPHVYSKYWVTLFGKDSQTRALREGKRKPFQMKSNDSYHR